MSIRVMTEVWATAPVDGGTLLVLLALADSADETTRTCYPGIEALALKARLSDRQVQYCIQRLRSMGLVNVARGASPVKTNLYQITLESAWAAARDANIAPHAAKPETQSLHPRDAVDCVSETQPTSPKPSVDIREEPSDLFGSNEPQRTREAEKPKTNDETFARFWAVYPKKTGKPAARKAWDKAVKKEDAERIIAAAARYARTDSVARGYAKMAQGWLNDERWTDDDLPPETKRRQPPVHEEVFR